MVLVSYETCLSFTQDLDHGFHAQGSRAITCEHRVGTFVFICMAGTYIAGWSVFFYSEVFRWTWIQWPFFASCNISAFIATVCGGMFAAICWSNYGKGLGHYRAYPNLSSEKSYI